MVYIIPFIFTFFGIWLNSRVSSRKPVLVMYVITILYMVVLMSLRYRVGLDTISYGMRLRIMPTLSELTFSNIFTQYYEPAYTLIVAVSKQFTTSFLPIQCFMNALMSVCIGTFLYKNCKNPFIGLFFFILLQWLYFSIEIIRESVAIGIFLLNFSNYQKKRWIRYYLFSLLSISFHYSAFIIWFFPFVRFLKVNWIFLVACIGMLSVTPLLEGVNDMVSLGKISDKVNVYIGAADTANINWRIGEFIKTGLPAILIVSMYRLSKIELMNRPLVLLQILFCCGAFAIPIIFQRFSNYTSLFVVVALANYISNINVKGVARVFVISFVCLSQTYYYYSMRYTWYPYESYIDPVKDAKREEFYRIIW